MIGIPPFPSLSLNTLGVKKRARWEVEKDEEDNSRKPQSGVSNVLLWLKWNEHGEGEIAQINEMYTIKGLTGHS